MRSTEVTVSPTGEATVQTKGYQGTDCAQGSKFLEQALGERTAETKTAEYYQMAEQRQSIRGESRT